MAYRLPPRNTNFTGRDATLRGLRQCLTSANDVAMLVVHGLWASARPSSRSVAAAARLAVQHRLHHTRAPGPDLYGVNTIRHRPALIDDYFVRTGLSLSVSNLSLSRSGAG
ncbi:hypothetical protein [Streptomyces ureilyticus]|uniref:Uncharacterized protein n=1 Tax=Streptomyces ureilyticus TaxID=1775131 RepID=A0ABX0DSQ1_9ACTN|nr:hypothetical protein [Streptomyces ureilyticus]NGO42137.1 hypothetical protein [Streptomyces ureilyticus]